MITIQVTLCDWRTDKGQPCGERANILVTLTLDGKRYEADFCDVHSKQIATNAREATTSLPAGYTSKTTLPRAEGRKPQEQLISDPMDRKEAKRWALATGLIKSEKGRLSEATMKAWLDAGEPREVADGTFKSAG